MVPGDRGVGKSGHSLLVAPGYREQKTPGRNNITLLPGKKIIPDWWEWDLLEYRGDSVPGCLKKAALGRSEEPTRRAQKKQLDRLEASSDY